MTVNYYAPFGDGNLWRNITNLDDTTYGQIAIIGGKRKLVVGDKIGELCLVGGKRRYWVEVEEELEPIPMVCTYKSGYLPHKLVYSGRTYWLYKIEPTTLSYTSAHLSTSLASIVYRDCCEIPGGGVGASGGYESNTKDNLILTRVQCQSDEFAFSAFRCSYESRHVSITWPLVTHDYVLWNYTYKSSSGNWVLQSYNQDLNKQRFVSYTRTGTPRCPYPDAQYSGETNDYQIPPAGVPLIAGWINETFTVEVFNDLIESSEFPPCGTRTTPTTITYKNSEGNIILSVVLP